MAAANAFDVSLSSTSSKVVGPSVVSSTLSYNDNALLNALPAAVILLDTKGVVSHANPVAIALLGEPLTGQRWFDVISRCFSPRSDDGLEVSLKDGRRVKLQISALTNGQLLSSGQLIMLTDLTQTRQLQSRVSHMQRLSTLGKMMATLAHQIRTPLSAALLYAQNLANPRATMQMQQQFQQKLVSRLNDLEHQVNDMLLFARSGVVSNVQPFSLSELITELENSAEALLQQHEAALTLNCDEPQIQLLGSSHALSGALQNLIENSIHAISYTAKIEISFKRSAQVENTLLITLKDNGPGVDASLIDTLFEPFVTTKAQGTGLGLAVVQAVAHSHHGSVRYIANESGACFELSLPIHHQELKG